jgi:ketosteroid isomerase-like protein
MNEDLAQDFVKRFAAFWRAPTSERLDTVLASDATLSAPMVATTHGLEAGRRVFADLFELIPDMTAEVHRWGATADGVLIEFTVRGTAGGSPVSWESVDRFVLNEDGLASERFTYFDSLPLVTALARRPKAWPGFVRGRVKQMRCQGRSRIDLVAPGWVQANVATMACVSKLSARRITLVAGGL